MKNYQEVILIISIILLFSCGINKNKAIDFFNEFSKSFEFKSLELIASEYFLKNPELIASGYSLNEDGIWTNWENKDYDIIIDNKIFLEMMKNLSINDMKYGILEKKSSKIYTFHCRANFKLVFEREMQKLLNVTSVEEELKFEVQIKNTKYGYKVIYFYPPIAELHQKVADLIKNDLDEIQNLIRQGYK